MHRHEKHVLTNVNGKNHARISVHLIPEAFIKECDLCEKVHKGYLHVWIGKCIYGLPQAGRLANDLLRKRWATCGYTECTHTTGLWRHVHRPVAFALVVDDLGVKFVGVEHLQHLVTSLICFMMLKLTQLSLNIAALLWSGTTSTEQFVSLCRSVCQSN